MTTCRLGCVLVHLGSHFFGRPCLETYDGRIGLRLDGHFLVFWCHESRLHIVLENSQKHVLRALDGEDTLGKIEYESNMNALSTVDRRIAEQKNGVPATFQSNRLLGN